MSQTFTTPSAPPVASRELVESTVDVTTGVACGLSVRASFGSISVSVGRSAYMRIESEREHTIR